MTEEEKRFIILGLVMREYHLACKKHPNFSEGEIDRAFVILTEEVGEVAKAIQEESLVEMETEIAQVAAVCFRMLELLFLEEK